MAPASGFAAGLPIEARYAASEAVGREDASYAAGSGAVGYELANAANGYEATVAADGFRVSTGADSWSLTLRGVGYGWARPLGGAVATTSANRVEYDHGAISQWYVNGPLGLQQGFALDARPGGSPADGPLTITLAVDGLTPTAGLGGTSVALARADGTPVATYGGLIAYDAEGRSIPATMTVDAAPGGPTIAIRVDDADAVYPLVVDPYVQTSSVTTDLSGEGYQIAVSADGLTMAVGVPASALVLIYEKSADGWVEAARLQRREPAFLSRFGATVALSADGSTLVGGGLEYGRPKLEGVYDVYKRGVEGWGDPAHSTLTAPAGFTPGWAAAIDAPGRTIAVTGFAGGADGQPSQRAILIYNARADDWALASIIASPDLGPSSSDDGPIDLDDAGENLVVGVPGASEAYFFRLDPVDGWAWAGEATTPGPGAAALYGGSVAISGDGRTALVGGAIGAGHPRKFAPVQVYTRTGGYWARTGQLSVDVDPDSAEGLGGPISLNEDGTIAVAATSNASAPTHRAGSVYVFVRRGDTWHVESRLDSPNDPAVDDHFGDALAIRGGVLYAGASRHGAVGGGQGTIKIDAFAFEPAPLILEQPTNRRAILGRTATFTATAEDPGMTARWEASRDGGATWDVADGTSSTVTVAGATQSWLAVDAVAMNAGMLVRVVFTDPESGASAVGAPAVLHVVKPATSFETYMHRNPLPFGTADATITVRVASTDALTSIPDGGDLAMSFGGYVTLTRTVQGGLATFQVPPTIPVGSYFLGLVYQPGGPGEVVQSIASDMLVVVRAPSAATLEAPGEALQGDAVAMTAVISRSSSLATARGGVVLLDGGQPVAFEQTTLMDGRTVATFSSGGLAAGDHYLQLVYLGDPTTAAAASGVYRVSIKPAGSAAVGGLAAPLAGTTPAAPSPGAGPGGTPAPSPATPSADGRVVQGEAVTFSADIQGAYASVRWQYAEGDAWVDIYGPNRPWYTRTANLDDSGRNFRALFVDEQGATTTAGPYSIEVVSGSVYVDVHMRPMTVGQETTIFATLRSSDLDRPPTGFVRATFGAWAVWAPIVDGKAYWSVKAPMTVASHQVRIDYVPAYNDPFPPASTILRQVVTRGVSSLNVSAPQAARVGDLVSIVAQVATDAYGKTPTGGVMVLDGGRPIAFVPAVDLVDGSSTSVATFSTRDLAAGDHYFQLVYLGDPQNTMASSGVYKVTIAPAATPRSPASASTPPSRSDAGADDVNRTVDVSAPSTHIGLAARAARPSTDAVGRLTAIAKARPRVAGGSWWRRTGLSASSPEVVGLQR